MPETIALAWTPGDPSPSFYELKVLDEPGNVLKTFIAFKPTLTIELQEGWRLPDGIWFVAVAKADGKRDRWGWGLHYYVPEPAPLLAVLVGVLLLSALKRLTRS